jgi:large subunit ribosomal protein L18
MARTSPKIKRRFRRKKGARKNLLGTSARPRLSIYRSNTHIYAQIVDDDKSHTLVSASTVTGDCKSQMAKDDDKSASAKKVGLVLAERAKAAGIESVIFDRNGFKYHGRIASLADGAREGGLVF